MDILSITIDKKNKIEWMLTKCCNYKCEYCSEGKYKPSNDNNQKNLEKQAVLIKKIIIKNKQKVGFEFFGGEPTIFNLSELIKILDNEYITDYLLITNLSRDKQYYLELYNVTKYYNKKLKITASLHETQCDYKEFLNKINFLIENGLNISLQMVVNNNNLKLAKKIYKTFLHKKKFCVERDGNNKLNGSKECIEFVNSCNEKNKKTFTVNKNKILTKEELIFDKGIVNLYNYKCYINTIRIDPFGKIGTACKYNNSIDKNIYDEDYILDFEKNNKCKKNGGCNLCHFYKVEK